MDIEIIIEFNQENKLTFMAKGNIKEELTCNDEIKAKINKLTEKSDTSNVLMRVNANYTNELYKAIQTAFENAVTKEYEDNFKDKQ